MANAFIGKLMPVYVALQATKPTTTAATQYIRWGAVRDREFGPELDEVDATTDTSDGVFREYLSTFATHDVSLSGVTSTKAADNLDDIEDYFYTKMGAAEQVVVWVKIFRPSSDSANKFRSYEFPANMKTFKITGTYDDVSTWSSDLSGTGAVTVADGTANTPQNTV